MLSIGDLKIMGGPSEYSIGGVPPYDGRIPQLTKKWPFRWKTLGQLQVEHPYIFGVGHRMRSPPPVSLCPVLMHALRAVLSKAHPRGQMAPGSPLNSSRKSVTKG